MRVCVCVSVCVFIAHLLGDRDGGEWVCSRGRKVSLVYKVPPLAWEGGRERNIVSLRVTVARSLS